MECQGRKYITNFIVWIYKSIWIYAFVCFCTTEFIWILIYYKLLATVLMSEIGFKPEKRTSIRTFWYKLSQYKEFCSLGLVEKMSKVTIYICSNFINYMPPSWDGTLAKLLRNIISAGSNFLYLLITKTFVLKSLSE